MKKNVFIIFYIVNLIVLLLIMLPILSKRDWWMLLLMLLYAAIIATLYFSTLFGVKKGLLYALFVWISVYSIMSYGSLLPFIKSDGAYEHLLYMAIASLWLVSIAIIQAFTYQMPLAMRTVFSFFIIIVIHFFIIPIFALFNRYYIGDFSYYHFEIQLSGYFIIIGFSIIYYIILLFLEMIWLVKYSITLQNYMIGVFVSIMSIPIIIALRVGLWETGVVAFFIMMSIIVVSKTKVEEGS